MRTLKISTLWLLLSLVPACGRPFVDFANTGNSTAPVVSPTVTLTVPADAAADVSTNTTIAAAFSEPLDPVTITATTFTVSLGTTPVLGTVACAGNTATFTPASALEPGVSYTATITTGAKGSTGATLAAAFFWRFTTRAVVNIVGPAVTLAFPGNAQPSVSTNTAITATFNEPMNQATITPTTFAVKQGTTAVSGTVTCTGNTATFTPASDLAVSTFYTVTISTGASDLAGNALESPYVWSFTTAPTAGYYVVNEFSTPLFSTLLPDQAYVIKDNVNYKLYYAGDDFASINLAQSPDGIVWTPYVNNPIVADAQYHADVKYYEAGFTGANAGTDPSALLMNYRMWYQGLNGNAIDGWRYAESPDGINWYNHLPVTQFGSPVYSSATGIAYGIVDAIYTPGASNTGTDWTFRIYANEQWESGAYGGKELVVMAFSANGYDWTGYDPTGAGYATPVFAGTLTPGQFDCDHIGWFKVVKSNPTDWEAFYSGGQGSTYEAVNGIGYAASSDGIHWTRRQTIVTTYDGVPWRSQSVWMPSIVRTGNDYQIFFIGADNPHMPADWIQWKLGSAILTPAANPPVWSDQRVVFATPSGSAYYPSVLYDAAGFGGVSPSYAMWYSDGAGGVYVTRAPEGRTWTAPTTTSGLGSAHHVQILYDANGFGVGSGGPVYKIWYWDMAANLYDISSIATAQSVDGVSWTNITALSQDAVAQLVTGSGTGWNRGSYGPISVLYQATPPTTNAGVNPWSYSYVMYYDGTDGSHEDTGLAYSADGIFWTAASPNPVLGGSLISGWDCTGASYGTVHRDAAGFHFWYSGGGGDNGSGGCAGGPINQGIGYAFSPDGLTWVKDATNPIFSIGDGVPYRSQRVYTPAVVDDGTGILKMYFSALGATGPNKIIGMAILP